MFLFETSERSTWVSIFKKIDSILQIFSKYKDTVAEDSVIEMTTGKLFNRLENLEKHNGIYRLLKSFDEFKINGRPVKNLGSLRANLEQAAAQLQKNVQISAIHGDLCLSNILYDQGASIIRFLDPRGSFGKAGIFGDPRYDIAKLYHSVFGLYDFIVADLFSLRVIGNNIDFKVHLHDRVKEVQNAFVEVLLPKYDIQEIRLHTAFLFASMITLHFDKPDRQIAMLATSLLLFEEYFSDEKLRIAA